MSRFFRTAHIPSCPPAGDCKVVRWPEAAEVLVAKTVLQRYHVANLWFWVHAKVSSFVPGRECHLDGLITDLNDTLLLVASCWG